MANAHDTTPDPDCVLLTGATGYVGGRLLKRLEARGARLKCLTRRPDALAKRADPATEIVRGDVRDRASLAGAFEGVRTAYYLVHALGSTDGFEREEREAAEAFAEAARAAGVRRIIYLGGLAPSGASSPHLATRLQVGEILRHAVSTIELRASIIIGSGSLSFEMIRALVEKLPVMVTPKWVDRLAQPIGIDDVLDYLLEALAAPDGVEGVFEIGGPDRASYMDLLREYARQRGLRRAMIRVPVLTPRLSSLWLGLVTPVYARIGRKLVDSIVHDTVVQDRAAARTFAVRPCGLAEAVRRALANEDREFAETRWSDALSSAGPSRGRGGATLGRRIVDSYAVTVAVPPERAFAPIEAIGGTTGWYYANWLWRIRGFLDLLVGGVGVRRGRGDPTRLSVGDTVDWWRVERIERPALLQLFAEMKIPGRAWLQFEVTESPEGSTIRQTAVFDPLGLLGQAYWYLMFPLHRVIFAGMLRRIALAAEGGPSPGGTTKVVREPSAGTLRREAPRPEASGARRDA